MIVTTLLLFMRSALLYFVAGFAPLVWSTSVLPMIRGAVRRLVHVAVALVLAKPAIVISLAIGLQLIASAPEVVTDTGGSVAAPGTLLTGFFCCRRRVLAVGDLQVVARGRGRRHRLGVAGGWGRSAMTAAQAAMMVKSMGSASAASAATRAIPVGAGTAGGGGGFGPPSGAGHPEGGPNSTPGLGGEWRRRAATAPSAGHRRP